jgi:putative ABC transport system ATP-binding protein
MYTSVDVLYNPAMRPKNNRTPPSVSANLPDGQGFIRLENLKKTYLEGGQERVVLQHTTLQMRRGEITAILGKSGSGKTTLLNLISGIDRADEGDVYVDSVRLTGMDDRARTMFRREKIGFIFQFFNLIPTLTVWENLTLPLELNGKYDTAGKRYAETLLAEVGLENRRKTYPDRLSGGEQQRVAIARALVHNPLILLADEPTGNLDEDTGWNILNLLDRLTRQSGKNMVLVTHSMEAAAIADTILTLHEGQLVEVSK